jgi:hypothetical protein
MTAVCGGLVLAGAFIARTALHGQERSASPVPPPAPPAGTSLPPAAEKPVRDFAKLPPLQQQLYLSAQRGADWLRRANRPDGRFVPGYLPALKVPLEGDPYLRQVGAAFGLARAARFLGDERQAAVARQAVLTLLLDTAPDTSDPQLRHTTPPSAVVNRLGAAGLLVLAINELPSPGEDLLEQSEQLCNFIRKQQQADGALACSDTPEEAAAADPDAINLYPGVALYGLMLSQRYRTAQWKTDAVHKALAYYRPWWKGHRSAAFVPWHTAACVEACLRTREPAFAEFAYEMSDWLCELQYTQLDPHHPLWIGGFMTWTDGKAMAAPPHVGAAAYAEGMAEAARLARAAADVPRYQRYREATERCLQFLATLQYSDANTQHFADWYRPVLLGGFYAGHQDGNLRLDYTQHAVGALVQYLTYVAD